MNLIFGKLFPNLEQFMKILAFSAGVLLPVGTAILLGWGETDSGAEQPVPQPIVQVAQPGPAPQLSVAPMETPQTPTAEAPVSPSKPLGLYPLDIAGVEQAWNTWTLKHNVSASAMALGFEGEILASTGHNRNADTPYPVASLSKAITAMCLNLVLADTPYDWSTKLAELAPALAALNMPPHEGAQALRLADLVTHTSGFPENIDGNETAGEGRNLFTQQHFAREALTNPARQSAKRQFTYSNVNYAVLGQIITALTGTPYSDACAARIMQPAGARDAVVGGRMWATGGFGGWSVSAEDYARFVMFWLGPDLPWTLDPQAFAFDAKSGAGLGVFHDIHRKTHTLHHTGLWRSKDEDQQHGALFVISETGATFAANWQGNLKPAVYKELHTKIEPYLR
jgi:hypothetical protein